MFVRLVLLLCLDVFTISSSERVKVDQTLHNVLKLRANISGDHSGGESVQTTRTTPVTVNVYWIRHGMSCANVIREFTRLGIVTQHSYADPGLTDCAVKTAHVIGPQIMDAIRDANPEWIGPLLVFSSALIRGIETALHNFANENVYPIPYIAEKDIQIDNTPMSWEEQWQNKLNRPPNSDADIKRIVHNASINPSDDPDRITLGVKDNYNVFKKEFPKILQMLLLENYMVPVAPHAEIPVVIVSHSGFMRDNLACLGKTKPRNNEVWMKGYTTEFTSEQRGLPRRELTTPPMQEKHDMGECDIPFESGRYPEYKEGAPTAPCARDVQRCSKTNWAMPRTVAGECCNVDSIRLKQ